MTETRKASHLRILQHGPSGPSDFETVKYLVDSGLADAHLRMSYERETYGRVADAIWVGPTALGYDYLEELIAADVDLSAGQVSAQAQPNNDGDHNQRGLNKPPPLGPIRAALRDLTWSTTKALTAALALTAFGAAASFLASYLELFQ